MSGLGTIGGSSNNNNMIDTTSGGGALPDPPLGTKRHGQDDKTIGTGTAITDATTLSGNSAGSAGGTHTDENIIEKMTEVTVGNWEDGKRNGWGKYMYPNGDMYEGNWKDDKKHGKGKYTYANGEVYDGNWKDGKMHGEGKYTCANGDVYDGNWKNGTGNGEGKYTYADGAVYDGNWKDDQRHGEGKLTFASGAVYDGNWKDGMMHGEGKYTYADGDVYDGNWKDDQRHGEGKLTFASGAVYDGNWKDGMMHGEGKYTYADGDVYDGNWKDDQRHGKGKYTDANGAVHDGNWEDDEQREVKQGDPRQGTSQNAGGTGSSSIAGPGWGDDTDSVSGDKYFSLRKFGNETIRNETDKVVYAIVTDMSPETPPQMRPIDAHKCQTFNLSSSDYYLTYYTQDIVSGRNVFHEVNVKVKGKNDYVILPEYLENEVELSEEGQRILSLLETEYTKMDTTTPPEALEVNQGKGGPKQGTSQNVGGTEPSSTAGPGQGGQRQDEGGDANSVFAVKYFSRRKVGNETIRNETDKVVYAIVTDMSPKTPHQMRPIDAHKCHTFNLSSSDYYLTYYTKDIASGRNVFHEVNVKLPRKSNYVILPEYLENHLDISEEDPRISLLETEYYTKMDTTTPPVAQYQFVNQGVGGPNQGTSQNVGGTGSSSTAGPGQGSQNQGGQNQGDGGGKKPARDHPFINRVKYAFGKKCQSTIYNVTDKAVYVIVTSRIIGTTTTNTTSANIGGNSAGIPGSASGTHTNQNNMGPTPPQMRPIPPHKNRTYNLESCDYYLTYYTKDIASGRNVFHEVNVKVRGKNDYVIEPEDLDYEVELAPLLEEEITRLVLPNHA